MAKQGPGPLPTVIAPSGAFSVRAHLVTVVGVLAVALLVVGAYQTAHAFSTARREAALDAAFQARLASQALASSMQEGGAFTAATATNPSVVPAFTDVDAAKGQCSLTAGGTGLFPEGTIHFIDRSGFVFCSSAAERIDRQDVNVSGLDWFVSAMTAEPGSPVVADPFVDPTTGKRSIAFAAPVADEAGVAIGVVAYALPVDGIAAPMETIYGSRARLAFNVTWDPTADLVSSTEGAIEAGATTGDLQTPSDEAFAGLDGVRRYYRAASDATSSFTVTAGVSEAVTLAEAWARLREHLALTLTALALTLGLGMVVNRRIGGPLRRLTGNVEETGRAAIPQPVTSDGPREVRQLVEAFNGMLAARAGVEEQLRQRAMFDELTGLPNRIVALDRLTHALERTRRDQDLVAVLSIDLDRFSLVNESLGRDVGDRMLIQVAGRIKSVLRPEDTIARFYGDEFVIVCESLEARDEAAAVADRISEVLRRPLREGGSEATISVSIGIATGTYGGDTALSLLSDADAARTLAKQRGKARYEFFEQEMHEGSVNRLDLENDLRHAVERDELRLVYQPLVDLQSQRIVGAEALVRWDHPTKGLLLPGVFLDLAEETGLIVPIGQRLLRQACGQAAEWSRQGNPIRVSVNLSPRQLSESGLNQDIESVIRSTGLDPALLCIEITENTLMREDAAGAVLDGIRRLGAALSVDDFGTGYSSLAYLQRFALDELKIDRSFVRDLGTEASASAIVSAIVGVARALGLSIVAEGIEEVEQLEALRGLHCDIGQGYLFMRPQPPEALSSLLELDGVSLPVSASATDRS
jgi:diguanylate cyclase (GGDEF)-like protein